jgi:Flp pilus assembly pilin Flp
MLNLYRTLQALRANPDRGVTAVEYGLILAAVVVVIGAAVFVLGGDINGIFGNADTCVNGGC